MFVRIMIPVDSLNDLEVNEDIKIFSSMKSFFFTPFTEIRFSLIGITWFIKNEEIENL